MDDRFMQASVDNEVDVAHVTAHAAHDERGFIKNSAPVPVRI